MTTAWGERTLEAVMRAGNRYYVRMHGYPKIKYAICDSEFGWDAKPIELCESEGDAYDKKRAMNARAAILAYNAALREPSEEMVVCAVEALGAHKLKVGEQLRAEDTKAWAAFMMADGRMTDASWQAMLTRADEEIR